jgi:polysaccharide export outer membrane protein
MKSLWKKLFIIINTCLIVPLFCLGQEKPVPGKSSDQSRSAQSVPQLARPGSLVKTAVANDFIIGPGDVLNISVWREPDLSKNVTVRPDGKISLPLTNDIQASGFTAIQLKEIITEKLKSFVTDQNVTVTVEAVNSQRVTIMGEVTAAGNRPLTGPLRIMDILATTGFTPFAKTAKIYVLRTTEGKSERLLFNYKDFIKGKCPEQNIVLKNGDSIIVP